MVIQGNAFENVFCEMTAILSRPQCLREGIDFETPLWIVFVVHVAKGNVTLHSKTPTNGQNVKKIKHWYPFEYLLNSPCVKTCYWLIDS